MKNITDILQRGILNEVADWTRLELATSGVTGRHSNQLNYQSSTNLRLSQTILKKNLVGDDGIEPPTPSL